MRSRVVPTAILGGLLAFVGPRLTMPHDKSAGEPFQWEPPAGFDEMKGAITIEVEPAGRKWRLSDPTGHPFVPRVILTHSPKTMAVDESELARIAAGMPEEFRTSGLTWVERRHETRVRPDGARVGLIEADCERPPDTAPLLLGRPEAVVKFRKLQLVFPEDEGTSIVTADFAEEEASTWEPIFEASIAKAKGVATRVPPPPTWVFAGWGAAGLVLGWLASALVIGRKKDDAPPSSRRDPPKKDEA
ncbi:MAG TPA: hypothetical protein VIF62_33210 [Labilithrix sp.]